MELKASLIMEYLFVTSLLIQSALGGSCWANLSNRNKCADLISSQMTKKECCDYDSDGATFYSDDESPYNIFNLKFILSDHKCTPACDGADCEVFKSRCKENELCRMKNGIPRCLCDPNCSQHKLSKRGKVCGDDGQTYRSHCQLRRQNCRRNKNVRPSYFGQCKAYSCKGIVCAREGTKCVVDQYNSPMCVEVPTYCEDNSTPQDEICATNNQTFSSICHMTKYNIENGLKLRVQYHKRCTESMSCSKDRKCKHCLLNRQSSSHVCLTTSCPKCHSESESPKVCGTDGITYDNECMLRRHACLNSVDLQVSHIDSCEATDDEILWTAIHAKKGSDDVFKNQVLTAVFG